MDSERWKQVDDVLQSVLDRPPEERDAFLRQACAGDQTLEREVRSLLRSDEQAGRFLENPALEVAARAVARRQGEETQESSELLIGRSISHYRIVGKVGAGGMGVVYEAEQEQPRRTVALKVIKPGTLGILPTLRRSPVCTAGGVFFCPGAPLWQRCQSVSANLPMLNAPPTWKRRSVHH